MDEDRGFDAFFADLEAAYRSAARREETGQLSDLTAENYADVGLSERLVAARRAADAGRRVELDVVCGGETFTGKVVGTGRGWFELDGAMRVLVVLAAVERLAFPDVRHAAETDRREMSLASRLRRELGSRSTVRVVGPSITSEGRLDAVARDYVQVAAGGKLLVHPLATITHVVLGLRD